MFKILQAKLQQYVNRELPDVQEGFREGRGTRDQIANIHWIIKKKQESSRKIEAEVQRILIRPLVSLQSIIFSLKKKSIIVL